MSISVLIPSYNEEATLSSVFGQARQVLEGLKIEHEIILCDDASQDSTKQIIRQLVASYPKARAIYHEQNQGLFKTFEELYQSAQMDLVILFPGDGQWSVTILPQALEMMKKYDVVIAARQQKQYPLWRKFNSWVFNTLTKLLYGIDLYDIGAVKLVRREILQNIPVATLSAFSEAERLLKAHKQGYKIGVIWVGHNDRKKGKAGGARLKFIIQAFVDLIVFRFRY